MKCTAVVDELMSAFKTRRTDGRIKDPKSIAIIERYAMKLSEQEFTPKALNSLMVLKLLIASGDDMPHDENSAESFQKAYRSWGVIYSRSLGSRVNIVGWGCLLTESLCMMIGKIKVNSLWMIVT